jgi:hypothetical protein
MHKPNNRTNPSPQEKNPQFKKSSGRLQVALPGPPPALHSSAFRPLDVLSCGRACATVH